MSYYNQYLNLKQAPHQSVDEYVNRFIELRMKTDQNGNVPVEQVVLKFIQGLKPQIMSLVYAGNPQNLNDAITIARNIDGRLVMANESKQVYILKD